MPTCWMLAYIVPVAKGSPSSDFGDYRPISNTLLPSKVFEKIAAGKFGHFLESSSLLLSQCSHRMPWVHVMLCSHCLTVYKLLWTGAWKEGLFS